MYLFGRANTLNIRKDKPSYHFNFVTKDGLLYTVELGYNVPGLVRTYPFPRGYVITESTVT